MSFSHRLAMLRHQENLERGLAGPPDTQGPYRALECQDGEWQVRGADNVLVTYDIPGKHSRLLEYMVKETADLVASILNEAWLKGLASSPRKA